LKADPGKAGVDNLHTEIEKLTRVAEAVVEKPDGIVRESSSLSTEEASSVRAPPSYHTSMG
jgi:hypothetical protein